MRRAIIGGTAVVIGVTGTVFVTGMRAKSPPVLTAVRKVGRAMRPLAIRSAGGPGASASIIHHIGRTTGRSYATPVAAVADDDGFVIALPYGLSADWLQNVLASGSATIVHDGATHAVDRPEVLALAPLSDRFSPADRRAHRLFGVEQCLRVHRSAADRSDAASPESRVAGSVSAHGGPVDAHRPDP